MKSLNGILNLKMSRPNLVDGRGLEGDEVHFLYVVSNRTFWVIDNSTECQIFNYVLLYYLGYSRYIISKQNGLKASIRAEMVSFSHRVLAFSH